MSHPVGSSGFLDSGLPSSAPTTSRLPADYNSNYPPQAKVVRADSITRSAFLPSPYSPSTSSSAPRPSRSLDPFPASDGVWSKEQYFMSPPAGREPEPSTPMELFPPFPPKPQATLPSTSSLYLGDLQSALPPSFEPLSANRPAAPARGFSFDPWAPSSILNPPSPQGVRSTLPPSNLSNPSWGFNSNRPRSLPSSVSPKGPSSFLSNSPSSPTSALPPPPSHHQLSSAFSSAVLFDPRPAWPSTTSLSPQSSFDHTLPTGNGCPLSFPTAPPNLRANPPRGYSNDTRGGNNGTRGRKRSQGVAKGGTLRSGLPQTPNRSPWTMWAGNVPSDASQEELWNFFSQRPHPRFVDENGSPLTSAGIESIHLIARSNCAFVNYISKLHLDHAIQVYGGVPLRTGDRKNKPLICRMRDLEDDARSGVGGQRGEGVHKRYLKDAAGKLRGDRDVVDDWERRNEEETYWSDGSSSSSLFEEYFPKRYFILKSHNDEDLDSSVLTGLWRTQGHNRHTLNQAFRTASEGVWIIFSANKSGEWYGYARMIDLIPADDVDESLPGLKAGGSFDGAAHDNEQLSQAFRIQWMKVSRLPFAKTRHLSNSFNQGREVKISRDGTELEPETGALLVHELLIAPPPLPAPPASNTAGRGRRNRVTSEPMKNIRTYG